MAYEQTQISPSKTWGDINKVLYGHGCEATRYTDEPGKGFTLEFIRASEVEVEGVTGKYRTMVRIPVAFDFSKCTTQKHRAQEIRTKWRSVYYWLKAQFDAIEKDIVAFEQAFMADTVAKLPDGREGRLMEFILPSISKGRLPGIFDDVLRLEE